MYKKFVLFYCCLKKTEVVLFGRGTKKVRKQLKRVLGKGLTFKFPVLMRRLKSGNPRGINDIQMMNNTFLSIARFLFEGWLLQGKNISSD